MARMAARAHHAVARAVVVTAAADQPNIRSSALAVVSGTPVWSAQAMV
jgi:hypothetical protein